MCYIDNKVSLSLLTTTLIESTWKWNMCCNRCNAFHLENYIMLFFFAYFRSFQCYVQSFTIHHDNDFCIDYLSKILRLYLHYF